MALGKDTVIDPVCGMCVKRDQLPFEYLHMQFSFCSEQCRERFMANPGLYVGKPGMKSVGQTGHEVLKRRSIQLTEALPSEMAATLHDALCAMMGIKEVEYTGTRWAITYDLLQATAEQIERTITKTGAGLDQAWVEKFRRAFVHCLEETELQSLEHTGGGHSH